MKFQIDIKEEWYKDPTYGKIKNKWNWQVWDERWETILDQGSNAYSEHDAKIAAEKAATLYYRQSNSKHNTYEFTPED